MNRFRFLCLALALVLVLGMGAAAAEVDCDSTYCFSASDFSEDALTGICITELPDSDAGTVFLGSRVLQPGDILTAEQLAQMTFAPLRTQQDSSAQVTFLPIYADRVEKSATVTIAIRGKEDKAPVAEDFAMETYKNLANTAALKASDPEGQPLTYTVTRQPRRGEVILNADGSFTYTPKKNKVGVDSFTYTAADPAGNVSREATVTVTILKPTDAKQYTDTVADECRFAAEWMRHTGLFVGEQVAGQTCFYPEKTVTKGEFLTMVMELFELSADASGTYTGMAADAPDWLKPYLAAAVRSGLIANTPAAETGVFEAGQPIYGSEAAVMLQNVLDLEVSAAAMAVESKENVPTWADTAVQVMHDHGVALVAEEALTRSQVARLLYRAAQLAEEAPGMIVLRMQK
ncbi:MAG: cadherin-like domain-containing protein [Oscillospiraceae bacterium]|nr:cadherin-like domain-containing protein [Oscillospiraceae bacterium]